MNRHGDLLPRIPCWQATLSPLLKSNQVKRIHVGPLAHMAAMRSSHRSTYWSDVHIMKHPPIPLSHETQQTVISNWIQKLADQYLRGVHYLQQASPPEMKEDIGKHQL